ncbi:cell wall hydrolase [Bacillus sp. DJP31]|uniref:cell wall hydrolase n=1 Tax=Bacillus sp. DJP31 TaxID=3409789 RepID=UPI003BB5F4F1
MRLRSIWRIPLIIMITVCFVVSLFPAQTGHAFSNQIIQRGATGDDVIELQARLQYNGYYHGPIDGVFGWSTYWSVRNFQKEFGLTVVDGFVGGKTKEMIVKATKYDKNFVYQQLQQGRRFTHYGGTPLANQSAPSQKMIEQAKKAAEKNRVVQNLNRNKELQKQGNVAQPPAAQKPPAQAQPPAAQQPPAKAQPPAAQKPQAKAQQPGAQKPQAKAQPPAAQKPQAKAQPPAAQKPQAKAQPPVAQKPQAKAQPPVAQKPQAKAQPPVAQKPQAKAQPPAEKQKEQPIEQEQEDTPRDTAVNMPNGFSQNDLRLMANAVYGESRGEPFIGQVAVAAVILNRINSPAFPNTVSGVIYEPRAFTAVADGQINLTPNEQAKKAVLDAINGFDPTESAIYYFNPDTATNGWIWGRPQIKKIGKHIFCK